MFHKRNPHIFVELLLVISLLVGCTLSQDTTIVWSDDFEDGNLDGWDTGWIDDDEYFVDEGVLTFGSDGSDIRHPSTVSNGTWSFDVFMVDHEKRTHDIRFTEGFYNYQTLEIWNTPNTQIWVSTQFDPNDPITDLVDLGEVVTGWHHFDITKDESSLIKVYMDGEFILEHFDDYSFDAKYVLLSTYYQGPALDNVVVRDKVIDIKPSK